MRVRAGFWALPVWLIVACASDDSEPVQAEPASCGSCLAVHCAPARDACADDAECSAYVSCLEACPTSAGRVDIDCNQSCPLPKSRIAQEVLADYRSCREGQGRACDECGLSSVGSGPVLNQSCGFSSEADGCARCEAEHCCETKAACEADPDCQEFLSCYFACPGSDRACFDECFEHPGAPLGMARTACLLAYCGTSATCASATSARVECDTKHCLQVRTDCFSTPDCYKTLFCVAGCPLCPECKADRSQAGLDAYDKYSGCLANNCL